MNIYLWITGGISGFLILLILSLSFWAEGEDQLAIAYIYGIFGIYLWYGATAFAIAHVVGWAMKWLN